MSTFEVVIVNKNTNEYLGIVLIISCVLVLGSPFAICDLYFSYNSISCQNEIIPFNITLATWLQVNGYIFFCYILFLIIFSFIIKFDYNKTNILILRLVDLLLSLFSFAWLIIGCVIFWKYLEPSKTCNSDITNYMWTRLILGLIGMLSNLNKRDKKN